MGKMDVFVEVDGGADGIGKIIDFDEETAEVEYFDRLQVLACGRCACRSNGFAESNSPLRPVSFGLILKELPVCRTGRRRLGQCGSDKAKEDHYHVRFPNNQDARIPVSQLYVRWSHPVEIKHIIWRQGSQTLHSSLTVGRALSVTSWNSAPHLEGSLLWPRRPSNFLNIKWQSYGEFSLIPSKDTC